jgi:parvulin-like peptidyl-prolyl isomerase
LLATSFKSVPASEIAQQFGEGFARAVGGLSPGEWHGPLESGYGVHLVFISARTEGHLATLEEVRDAVSREWANAQREKANEALYQRLLARYKITIEQPEETGAAGSLVGVAKR